VHVFSMRDPRNEPSPDAGSFVSRVDYESGAGTWQRLRGAARAVYSFEARRRLKALIRRVRPHVVHHHNIAHHLSPSVVDAAHEEHVPQVQTLHDYKLLCPVYVLMRGGAVCEECRPHRYSRVVAHRCNRGSLLRSAVNFVEMELHHRKGTYSRMNLFLCPSTFQLETVKRFGWPDSKLAFVPHYVATRGVPVTPGEPLVGGYLGRLSAEKGLDVLLDALRDVADLLPRGWQFRIAGDGPKRAALEARAAGLPVKFLGHLSGEDLESFWRGVRFTVMPSTWYEVRPISIHEAFAHGKAVVASGLGSMPELVRPGDTGLTAVAGNRASWAEALRRAYGDPPAMAAMGARARRMAERELAPERHLEQLLECYGRARA
jgi:glycosyltransferase involved in cell wall biosynthesis